jgi:hypothetical protein
LQTDILQFCICFYPLAGAMSVADPPVPVDPSKTISQSDAVDTSLPEFIDTDSASEDYADAVEEFPSESNDDDAALPKRLAPAVQVFRVSVQLDKFYLSLLNNLGLWSNPVLDVQLIDTMVDYLVGTDSLSSMGLSSCIMLNQWNPSAKVFLNLINIIVVPLSCNFLFSSDSRASC